VFGALLPRERGRWIGCAGLVAILLAAGATLSAPRPGTAATSSAVVEMTVPSATTLIATGCQPGVAATDFGTVLPGTTAITTGDCSVTWGSSNNTSSLRMSQVDGGGVAMQGETTDQLDPGFGTAGIYDEDFGLDNAMLQDFAVQADGGIIVTYYNAVTPDFYAHVRRIAPNGTNDGSFNGGTGVISYPMNVRAGTVAALPSGRFAVAVGSGVELRDADGDLVPTFGAGGSVDLGFGDTSNDWVEWIVSDGDGLVVATVDNEVSSNSVVVRRLTATGLVDSSWGTGGAFTYDPVPNASITDGIRLRSGEFVIVGNSDNQGLLIHLDRFGAPIPTFGVDGIALIDAAAGGDGFQSVGEQIDGSIVVLNMNGNTKVHRIDVTGAIDPTFATAGTYEPTFGVFAGALGMTTDVDGSIWLQVMWAPPAATARSAIVKLTPDGSPDVDWSPGGMLDIADTDYFQYGDPELGVDGKLVAPLADYVMPTPFVDLKLARLDADSIPDFSGSWAGGSAFGVCLHDADAGSTPVWTEAGSNNCTAALTANWRAVPTTPSTVASRGASSTGTSTFRFGVRAASAQAPGSFSAPIALEVVAPSV
jgi:hypothetical protein